MTDPLITALDAELDADLAAGQAAKKVVLFTPAERREGDALLDEENKIVHPPIRSTIASGTR